jgi:hypothetical protein
MPESRLVSNRSRRSSHNAHTYTFQTTIGDFICGINGKPLKDLLKGEIGSGFSDTQLVELVNSMQRPITFNFNSMPTIAAAAAAAETSSSSAPRVGPPVAITLPRGSSGTVYEKGPIKVGAGEKLLFPLPVSVGVGTKVIIEFWIAEEELDIWFSLQRKGKTDIVYPYTTKKHVGTSNGEDLPFFATITLLLLLCRAWFFHYDRRRRVEFSLGQLALVVHRQDNHVQGHHPVKSRAIIRGGGQGGWNEGGLLRAVKAWRCMVALSVLEVQAPSMRYHTTTTTCIFDEDGGSSELRQQKVGLVEQGRQDNLGRT